MTTVTRLLIGLEYFIPFCKFLLPASSYFSHPLLSSSALLFSQVESVSFYSCNVTVSPCPTLCTMSLSNLKMSLMFVNQFLHQIISACLSNVEHLLGIVDGLSGVCMSENQQVGQDLPGSDIVYFENIRFLGLGTGYFPEKYVVDSAVHLINTQTSEGDLVIIWCTNDSSCYSHNSDMCCV